MYYKNKKTNKIIYWKNMNFGTFEKSFCGICGIQEDGYFDKNEELVEDIICNSCAEDWVFCDDDDDDEKD